MRRALPERSKVTDVVVVVEDDWEGFVVAVVTVLERVRVRERGWCIEEEEREFRSHPTCRKLQGDEGSIPRDYLPAPRTLEGGSAAPPGFNYDYS